MSKLIQSESLHRKIRKGSPAELATSSWDLIADAIKSGKKDEALELLDFTCKYESQASNDGLVSFVEMVLTHLATNFGEEEIMKVFKERYTPRMAAFLATTHGVEDVLQRVLEAQRRHHAECTVIEEPDRYVVKYDPCGTGGRLRRTREVGLTKRAHPWSWGKAGVPYYCCHCCANWEITGIALQGYPVRITLIGDKPEDKCIHLYYKKPELIPEEYFTRIGLKKKLALKNKK